MGDEKIRKTVKKKDYNKYPFMNLSLVHMKGEKWRDIPSFDGYYCVSNYGRIWALSRPISSITGQEYFTRERIRKQRLARDYNSFTKDYTLQLTVNLRYEGKVFNLKVNRLVYDLFVKPIRERGKKILIVHEDGDNCNNRSENLVPMTGTELHAHCLKLNRKPRSTRRPWRKDPKGWSGSNAPSAVVQYTLDGKKKKEFESVAAAARAIGASRSSIRGVLKKRLKQLYGFVFRFKGDHYRGEYADFSWEKPVTQYSIEGRKVAQYPSLKAASLKTAIDAGSISKCALGKMRLASGFVWRFDGEAYRGEYKGKIANLPRPIVQFSLDGKIMARYASVNEACRKTAFSPATLLDCAFRRTKVSHGFVWRFEGDAYKGEFKTHRVGKPVTQQTREGMKLQTYPTIEAAAKASGLTPDNIQKNVKGENKTAGGFVWRYATKEEIKGLPAHHTMKRNQPAFPGKEVVQYSTEGKKIAEYESLTKAAAAVKSNYTNIAAVVNKPNRTAAGFVWRTNGMRYYGEIARKPPSNRAKTVTQYDKRGNRIASFNSTRQAEKETGIPATTISAVANGKLKTTGGFFWRYGHSRPRINVATYDPIPSRKPVIKYSLDGNRVAEYTSIVEAAKKEGISAVRISEVINGRSNSAAGHLWRLKSLTKRI